MTAPEVYMEKISPKINIQYNLCIYAFYKINYRPIFTYSNNKSINQ